MSNRKVKDKGRVKCQECGKILASKEGLKRHLYIHTNQWPHRCDECGKGWEQNQI